MEDLNSSSVATLSSTTLADDRSPSVRLFEFGRTLPKGDVQLLDGGDTTLLLEDAPLSSSIETTDPVGGDAEGKVPSTSCEVTSIFAKSKTSLRGNAPALLRYRKPSGPPDRIGTVLGVYRDQVPTSSLGEYAALCTAGVLSVADAIFLVGTRAELMVAACEPRTHVMPSVRSASPNRTIRDLECWLTKHCSS
ncbi:hypothetical protein PG997_006482 [Apiospora hydei]|uniref:Uncharacterized protein n=1 Tax=Apiospora hydei TaxID=1337664 RepID=A0ABR1WNW0_9PEZI